MVTTDPIADMLTRIRNANDAYPVSYTQSDAADELITV